MPYDSDKSESESILLPNRARRYTAASAYHLMGVLRISSSSMLATTAQEEQYLTKVITLLAMAANALEDIELRRNGKALLAGLGAQPILIREPAGD